MSLFGGINPALLGVATGGMSYLPQLFGGHTGGGGNAFQAGQQPQAPQGATQAGMQPPMQPGGAMGAGQQPLFGQPQHVANPDADRMMYARLLMGNSAQR